MSFARYSATPIISIPAQLRLIERRAGLADLRFDTDLASRRRPRSAIARRTRRAGSSAGSAGRPTAHSATPWKSCGKSSARSWLAIDDLRVSGAAGVAAARCCAARSTEAIAKLTTQDALTGLPNRRVMLERLEEAVASRHSGIVAFALIDIDGFRDINDTLGRAGGDTMLVNIAERLKTGLPADALFGRFEDDEFAVMVASDDAQNAVALGEQITAALAAPIYMDQWWQIVATHRYRTSAGGRHHRRRIISPRRTGAPRR